MYSPLYSSNVHDSSPVKQRDSIHQMFAMPRRQDGSDYRGYLDPQQQQQFVDNNQAIFAQGNAPQFVTRRVNSEKLGRSPMEIESFNPVRGKSLHINLDQDSFPCKPRPNKTGFQASYGLEDSGPAGMRWNADRSSDVMQSFEDKAAVLNHHNYYNPQEFLPVQAAPDVYQNAQRTQAGIRPRDMERTPYTYKINDFRSSADPIVDGGYENRMQGGLPQVSRTQNPTIATTTYRNQPDPMQIEPMNQPSLRIGNESGYIHTNRVQPIAGVLQATFQSMQRGNQQTGNTNQNLYSMANKVNTQSGQMPFEIRSGLIHSSQNSEMISTAKVAPISLQQLQAVNPTNMQKFTFRQLPVTAITLKKAPTASVLPALQDWSSQLQTKVHLFSGSAVGLSGQTRFESQAMQNVVGQNKTPYQTNQEAMTAVAQGKAAPQEHSIQPEVSSQWSALRRPNNHAEVESEQIDHREVSIVPSNTVVPFRNANDQDVSETHDNRENVGSVVNVVSKLRQTNHVEMEPVAESSPSERELVAAPQPLLGRRQ